MADMAENRLESEAGKIDLFAYAGVAWKLFKKSWFVCVLFVMITGAIGFSTVNRTYVPYYRA